MSGSFETNDAHTNFHLKPLRVAIRAEGVFEEAKNLVADLPNWSLVSADDARRVLTCTRKAGFLGAESTITITCDGPEGIPSTTVNVKSRTDGGLLSRDRANVLEFMVPFHRRVC